MTKLEKLLDLLHRADVTLNYWDGRRRGVVEREITISERKLLISALQRASSQLSSQLSGGEK